MALKTKVKAGNITNLSDARYCAGMGVDWLGFPVTDVNPVTFKEITDWVTGPQFILEVNKAATLSEIGQYPVSILEIPCSRLDLIHQLSAKNWMVRLSLSEWESVKHPLLILKDKISYLILNLDNGDVNLVKEMARDFDLLAQQNEKFSTNDLLSWPVAGINVTGDNEVRPGLKDFEKLSSILEELEVVD